MHRPALVAALTAALLALPTAALAHPAFNPNSIPAGEAVETVLVVPHGCAPGGGMPDEDGADTQPTVELAVQQQDGVTLEPGAVDGWDVEDDGEAWVWSDAGGATTDVLEFPVTVTLDATAAEGDAFHLKVFQACADGSSFQWIGTPDEEAEFPAVLLEASAGGVGEAEMDDDMEMDHGDMETEDDGETAIGDESPADDMTMDDEDGSATEGDDVAMDDPAEEGGVPTAVLVVLALVGLGTVAAVMVRRRAG